MFNMPKIMILMIFFICCPTKIDKRKMMVSVLICFFCMAIYISNVVSGLWSIGHEMESSACSEISMY